MDFDKPFPDYLAHFQAVGITLALNAPAESEAFHWPCGSGKSVAAINWGLFRSGTIVFGTKAGARHTIYQEFKKYTTVTPVVLVPKSERRKKDPDPAAEIERIRVETGEYPRVIIVAWESLPEWMDLLLTIPITSLVLDEIHMLSSHQRWIRLPSNPDAKASYERRNNRAAAVQRLCANAKRRLGMTATPVKDRVRDLWAQLDLVHPKAWGRFWDFCERYCNVTTTAQGYKDNRGSSNLVELDKRLAFVRHHVDYSVTHRDLPPKRRQVLYIGKAQQARIATAAFAKELERAKKISTKAVVEVGLAAAAARKLPVLLDHVRDSVANGGKVVVLTGRHNDCDRWIAAIRKELPNVSAWMAHGSHGTSFRDQVRIEFMAHPGPCVLVGGGEAWGESVSLNTADLAINAQLPITPKQLWQREGRFMRKDSKKGVLILYPVAEGTVDERLSQILLSKLPAVADLQHDSEFARAEADLASGGMDEDTIINSLLQKIISGGDSED
jgi:hypothetical protein